MSAANRLYLGRTQEPRSLDNAGGRGRYFGGSRAASPTGSAMLAIAIPNAALTERAA